MSIIVIAAAAIDAGKDRGALIRRGVNGTRRLVAHVALRNSLGSLLVAVVVAGIIIWSERQAFEVQGASSEVEVARLRELLHTRNLWITGCVAVLAVKAGWGLVDSARLRRKVAEGEWEPPPGR